MKRFNTTGTCFPDKHYMVIIDRQVNAAAELVRQGNYFCINRGRQYGKTTTLSALARKLKEEYIVFNISFEGTGDSSFASVENACDLTRTDVVIDYQCQQYVIELKIWHGDSYNQRGEKQLREYLEYFHLKKGYMVSFCFNKGKEPGVHTVKVDGAEIVEAIV